jgi:hypothetical protein
LELIFADALYDSSEWEEGKYSKDLLSRIVLFDPEASAEDTDIGHGADWPVVLVEIFKNIDWSQIFTLAGAGGVFLLGKQINENIDAWVEIGKKLKILIDKTKPTRVDEYAAVLLVIDELQGNNLLIGASISVQTVEFTPVAWGKGILGKRPDSLYIVTAKTANKAFVYGIKSNMKIEFRHEYSTQWIDFSSSG